MATSKKKLEENEEMKELMNKLDISWVPMTDDDLLTLAKNRFIKNHYDFNLKRVSEDKNSDSMIIKPIPEGLYDGKIFGSMYSDRCNCGKIREQDVYCDECKTIAFNSVERVSRYALIDLGYYYVTPVKVKELFEYLTKKFNVKIKGDYDPKVISEKTRTDSDKINLLYLTQMSYDPEKNNLYLTTDLTDKEYIGLDGLMKVFDEYFPESVSKLKKYINRYVPVLPGSLRKIKFFKINGERKIELPKSTAYYRALMIAKKQVDDIYNKSKDLYYISLNLANLKLMTTMILTKMSGLLKSSKQTYLRSKGYQVNSKNSGRAVIINAPELRMDQIGLPRAMIYEMMKKDFGAYCLQSLNMESREFMDKYNNPDEEFLKIFDEYAKTRVVLVNRPCMYGDCA